MSRFTFVIVPGDRKKSQKFTISSRVVWTSFVFAVAGVMTLAYCITDYLQLRGLRTIYVEALQENRTIRGEARILMSNLEDVKSSLGKVREYTTKLSEITNIQTNSLSKHTGIAAIKSPDVKRSSAAPVEEKTTRIQGVPTGVEFENLVFRPVFQRLGAIGMSANNSAFDLQHLIASLSQQKTLLASIPSINPVDGWITSGFGVRMSPFTGEKGYHKGIDVAASVGTPVNSPADGVVVFAGKKEGFGNFVMIAHGYGVVTGYGHNAQNLVVTGQVVKRGEQLATVGQTGRATGPHLHYEIWVNGRVVDPKRFIISGEEVTLASAAAFAH